MGKGVGIFVNEEVVYHTIEDLWWKKDWNHQDVVTLDIKYPKGPNKIELYGLEGCCSGNQSMRVKIPQNLDIGLLEDTEWHDLSVTSW